MLRITGVLAVSIAMSVCKTRIFSHAVENRHLVCKQILGSVEFRHLALIHHQYFVVVHYRVQAMSYGPTVIMRPLAKQDVAENWTDHLQNGAVGKLLSNCVLNEIISLHVNGSSGFVEN